MNKLEERKQQILDELVEPIWNSVMPTVVFHSETTPDMVDYVFWYIDENYYGGTVGMNFKDATPEVIERYKVIMAGRGFSGYRRSS